MTEQYEITLPEFRRGIHLITRHIENQLNTLPDKGMINIFIQHTSAGLTINENADPSVRYAGNMGRFREHFYQNIFQDQTAPKDQRFH